MASSGNSKDSHAGWTENHIFTNFRQRTADKPALTCLLIVSFLISPCMLRNFSIHHPVLATISCTFWPTLGKPARHHHYAVLTIMPICSVMRLIELGLQLMARFKEIPLNHTRFVFSVVTAKSPALLMELFCSDYVLIAFPIHWEVCFDMYCV